MIFDMSGYDPATCSIVRDGVRVYLTAEHLVLPAVQVEAYVQKVVAQEKQKAQDKVKP